VSTAAAKRAGMPGGGRVRLGSVLRSVAVGAFVLLCTAWYWHRCWMLQRPSPAPSDFQFYYEAAGRARQGGSPYIEGGYVYPPLLALLLVPLTRFDYLTARWIWFWFSHAVFLGAGWLLLRHLGRGAAALCCVALVWAAGGGAEDGFGLGQVDAVLVLLAIVAMVRGGALRAVAVGAGFALKLLPGILVLIDRRRRTLAATAAIGAVLMAAPWAVVRFGLKGPARPESMAYLDGTPCVLSWSLPSVAVRFADWPGRMGKLPLDWTFGYDLPKLRMTGVQRGISLAVSVLTLGLGLAAFARIPARKPDWQAASPLHEGAALLCLAVAASPVSWWHYPVLEYPAMAVLLTGAIRARRAGVFAATLTAAACSYLVPDAILKYYFHQQERWPDYPWVIQFWTAVPAFSALILFGLLLYRLRDSGTAHVE